MFIIGITGGIGCGKTTVANLCRQAGLAVIDADEISRQATAPDGLAIEPIVAAFGRSVLDAKGGLDRAKMARQVFADRRALDQLSQIVHREVIAEMQRQIEKLKEKKVKAAVLDVPIPLSTVFSILSTRSGLSGQKMRCASAASSAGGWPRMTPGGGSRCK